MQSELVHSIASFAVSVQNSGSTYSASVSSDRRLQARPLDLHRPPPHLKCSTDYSAVGSPEGCVSAPAFRS